MAEYPLVGNMIPVYWKDIEKHTWELIQEKYSIQFQKQKSKTLSFFLMKSIKFKRDLEEQVCKMLSWKYWIQYKIISLKTSTPILKSTFQMSFSFAPQTNLTQFSHLFWIVYKGSRSLVTQQGKRSKFLNVT